VPGTRHWQLHFDRLSAGIVDFVSNKKKLIIELDGSQHLEQEEYDQERTAFLESQGYKVIRFWNNDVMNDIDGVFRVIDDTLKGE
jgi:very-short-patch-repair endonuclease